MLKERLWGGDNMVVVSHSFEVVRQIPGNVMGSLSILPAQEGKEEGHRALLLLCECENMSSCLFFFLCQQPDMVSRRPALPICSSPHQTGEDRTEILFSCYPQAILKFNSENQTKAHTSNGFHFSAHQPSPSGSSSP